jgi:hypothetical protein
LARAARWRHADGCRSRYGPHCHTLALRI